MEEKYWKQFESSGRVEDYLSFASHNRQDEANVTEQTGTGSDAGIYLGEGNCTEADPGGGI